MDLTELVKLISRLIKFINTFLFAEPKFEIKTFDDALINMSLIVGTSNEGEGLNVHMTTGVIINLTPQGKKEFLNYFKEK